MDYTNLAELQQEWGNGVFNYPNEFNIANITYKFRNSSELPLVEYLRENETGYVIYTTSIQNKEQASEQKLKQWIMFSYQDNNNVLSPDVVETISPQRIVNHIGNIKEQEELGEQTQVIGEVVLLKIDLPSGAGAIKGKVDTGAEICSLHGDNIQMSGGNVKFMNTELSDNFITAPMSEKQAVKSSDGGVEYRPVIVLDCVINGKPVRQVQFNLNNRSHMDYKCLVGMNLLEKTGFMINPSQDESPHNEMRENNASDESPLEESEEDVWLDDENEQSVDVHQIAKFAVSKGKNNG